MNVREETLVILREMAKRITAEKENIMSETYSITELTAKMESEIELGNIPEIMENLHDAMGKLNECTDEAVVCINDVTDAYEDVINFMAKLNKSK